MLAVGDEIDWFKWTGQKRNINIGDADGSV